jgi:iron complex transport system substrate-binding protein
MRIFFALLLVLAFVIPFGVACNEPTAPAGAIVDDLGRTVTIEGVPERIVSLAPSCTEILFALGLEDKIVGVTEYCDYPEAAKEKQTVGGFSTVDLEKVAAADPDVIFAAGIHKAKTLPALESKGYTVVTLAPTCIEDVLDNITLVGDITGRQEQASDLVKKMRERIEVVTKKTETIPADEKPWALYVTWHEPIQTVGSGTLTNDLLLKAGGINIAHDMSDYPKISLETVVARNPQVIIACTGHGDGGDAPFKWAKSNEALSVTDARESDRIYEVDADFVTRGGPRIVEGLEWFAYFLHPDLFEAPA